MFSLSVAPGFPESVVVSHPLHIPDGFLSLAVSVVFWILTILAVGAAVRAAQSALGERQIPLVGVLAAAIFAAQMLNFPVAGGTSGHMLGGGARGNRPRTVGGDSRHDRRDFSAGAGFSRWRAARDGREYL